MATYGWRPVDNSGNPIPESNWNTPADWAGFPLTDPPVTGTVPGAGDTALIGAGTIDISFPISFSANYPVTIDVTDSRTVATLGLGGVSVIGVDFSLQPIYGTPTVLPVVKVTGGTLHVTGDVVDNFSGTITVPVPLIGNETLAHTFTGGGTIDLASHGTFEVGGAVASTVVVDFTDAVSNLLRLDGVTGAAPSAFAGTIEDFAAGDTILLPALHTATHFDATYAAGVLTIADDSAPTVAVATLDLPGTFTTANLALNAGAGGLSITLHSAVAPPGKPALTVASDSGASHTDGITNVTTPTFTGTAQAGATVDLFDGATQIGSGTASVGGAWTITAGGALAAGVHSIAAKEIVSGGTSAASAALSVTIDTSAPPVPGTPDLTAGSDSGSSSTDNVTKLTTPTFTGTGAAGARVTLFDGATAIGSATANGSGAWSVTAAALSQGVHAITAQATDLAGNASVASGALSVTIDSTAPLAPTTPVLASPHSGSTTTYNALTLTGSAEVGSKVTLLDGVTVIGAGTAGVGGAWSITSSVLAVGTHSIAATATDAAGNVGTKSVAAAVTILATHDLHWVAGNGNFNTVSDWEPRRVPGTLDNAILDAPGTFTVTASTSEAVKTLATVANAKLLVSAGTFAVGGGSGTGGLAGGVTIADGAALALAGAFTNSGAIVENGAATTTEILLTGAVTLSGHGSVSLSNSANNLVAAGTAGLALTNADNTITGAGTIGVGSMQLANGGVINANKPLALVLDTGLNTITNTGTLEATGAGGLTLNSAVDQSGGGTIIAAGTAAVVGFGGAILGGRLATSGGGVIRTNPGAAALDGQGLHSLTNTGTVQVADATALTLLGSITNSGTVVAASTGDTTSLVIGSPLVTLGGGGRVVLGGAGTSQLIATAANFSLDNVDNAISGAGLISTALTNAGTITADQAAALMLNGPVTNTGTMQATAAGGLLLQNDVVGNAGGTVQASGAGAHVDLSNATITGGKLHTASGGVIDTVGGGTLDGLSLGAVTSDAAIAVKDNEALTLLGTLVNSGTVSLQASTGASTLRLGSTTVTLGGGGAVSLSNNANNIIAGSTAAQRLVNLNNTIAGAGQIGAGSMRLTNQVGGIINANQATALMLNTGAAPIINGGLLEATNSGGLIVQSAVKNVGGTLLATGVGAHVDLAGVAVLGGTLATGSGGTIEVVQPNTTLDGLSAGTITNAGSIVVQDNAGLTLLGTINNTGGITAAAVAGQAAIVIGGPVTLTGHGSVLLTNNAGNQITGSGEFSTLVNSDNTIAGAGQLGVGTALSLANAAGGVINANRALALTLNTTGDVSNAGLIEATDTATVNGGLVLQSTTIDNAGGTVAANGAHSHVDLASGTIIGGTLVTTGGGAIQTAVGGGGGTLDGLDDGALTNAGLVRITDSTPLALMGAIVNNGTLNLNGTTAGNTDLQIASSVVTLTGGGTVQLSSKAGNRIVGTVATNRLVNSNNTIAGGGQLGAGSLALDNGGTVNASTAVGLTIDLGSQAGNNLLHGLMEATAAGGLSIAGGVIGNAGTMLAANGGKLTYKTAAVNVNNSGGVLVGGTWEASGIGSTLSVTGGAVTTDAATIILSGAGALFRAGDGSTFSNLEASLTTVAAAGALEVLAGRSYTTTKAVADNGTIQLAGGTLTAAALTIGAGGQLTGFGTVAAGNGKIADAGTIEANGGTLATAAIISGAGVLRADPGATVRLTAAGSAIGTAVNNGTITLAGGAGLDVTTAVNAASSGIFQLNASSLLEIAADQGAGDKISFLGTGELDIDAVAKFGLNVGTAAYSGPLVQHFGAGDTILLKDLAPTGLTPVYTAGTGLLQFNNGSVNVATLAFDNATLGAGTFNIANSGGQALLTHS